jgi:hypothetical protein
MLNTRVREVDPLVWPKCDGEMNVTVFVEPPLGVVIGRILRHCGLWQRSSARTPPAQTRCSVYDPDSDADGPTPPAAESRERVYVDMDAFWATF